MRACPVIPWPVSETGAFTPSLAWGSKTRGAGWGSGEILSHVSRVGEESLTPMCVSFCHIPPSSPKKAPKSHARKWEPCLALHAPRDSPGEGGDPDPALPHRDAAPSSSLSPSGSCGVPRAGAWRVPPPRRGGGPRPAAGPVPCRMSGSQTGRPGRRS